MRQVIPEILTLLAAADGRLQVSKEVLLVWDKLLDRFTDAQLREAAVVVAQRTHYGAPTVGDIVVQIEGVERVMQVRVRDLYDRYVLRDDGGYQTQAQLVRWFPDGREVPLALPAHQDNVTYDGGLGHIGADMDDLLDMGGMED